MPDKPTVRLVDGEVVTITIEAATVAHQFADGHVIFDVGPDDGPPEHGGRHTIELLPDMAGVTYRRLIPSEGQPATGEVWADANGEQYMVVGLGAHILIATDGKSFDLAAVHAGKSGPIRRVWAPPPPPEPESFTAEYLNKPAGERCSLPFETAAEAARFLLTGEAAGELAPLGLRYVGGDWAGGSVPRWRDHVIDTTDRYSDGLSSDGLSSTSNDAASDRLDDAIAGVREAQFDEDLAVRSGDTLIEPCAMSTPHSPHAWKLDLGHRDETTGLTSGAIVDRACPGVARPPAPPMFDEMPF